MGYELQYGSDWANVASCRELDLGLPSTSQTDEPVVQNGCVGCPASPTGQAATDALANVAKSVTDLTGNATRLLRIGFILCRVQLRDD